MVSGYFKIKSPQTYFYLINLRFKRAKNKYPLMKKFLVPILCLAIVSTSAHAAGDPLTGGGNTKKNVAVVHNIVSDKLPTRLLKTIKKEYKDYWITRLYREEANGKISYHNTVE